MNNLILQTNPKADYQAYKPEIDAAIERVLEKGWYILGEEVKSFEKEFAQFTGVKHCVGVANGTDALVVALKACGIGAGDAVITVSHTAVATVAAIEMVGAVPIFVDISEETFTLDINRLAETLKLLFSESKYANVRPKAIVPVHIYGHPVDMPTVIALAKQYGLLVIEDCAQCHGAIVEDNATGNWGDAAAFSFYPTKNLGALGDGGAVVTNRTDLHETMAMLREYGWRERYMSEIAGMNTRLDELQAAILRVKLTHLPDSLKRRNEIAQYYHQHLSGLPLRLPQTKPGVFHAFHLYVIRTTHRDRLKKHLLEKQVHTLIHYPVPVHLQNAYRERITHVLPLNTTELISSEILSLPNYPQLSDAQLATIVSAVAEFDYNP